MSAPLALARRGWRLLPVHSVESGRCSCRRKDCASPGKHPRIGAWQRAATADIDTIAAWAERWPACNWGVAAGAESGIIVLDVDVHEDRRGDESLLAFVDEHGPIAYVAHALTGSGGSHYYMPHPGGRVPNSANALGIGLDIRGDGGFVVCPPSVHVSGGSYQWAETIATGAPDGVGPLAGVNT